MTTRFIKAMLIFAAMALVCACVQKITGWKWMSYVGAAWCILWGGFVVGFLAAWDAEV